MRTGWAFAVAMTIVVAVTAQPQAASVEAPAAPGALTTAPDAAAGSSKPVTGNPAANGGDANGGLSTEGTGVPLQPNDLGYTKGEPNNRPKIPAP